MTGINFAFHERPRVFEPQFYNGFFIDFINDTFELDIKLINYFTPVSMRNRC
jgi:hypothetical protein